MTTPSGSHETIGGSDNLLITQKPICTEKDNIESSTFVDDRNSLGASGESTTVSLAGFEVRHGGMNIIVSEREVCAA